jgi:hypothetical protein
MIRRLAFVLLGLLAICSSAAITVPVSAAPKAVATKPADGKTALAIQVMELMNFDGLLQSMRSQVATSMEQSAGAANQCAAAKPEFDEFAKALSDKLTETLMSGDFKTDVAALYAETFDESELNDLIKFYKSPLGKKMIAHLPELTEKSMQISQARIQSVNPDLHKILVEFEPRIAMASKRCEASAVENTDSPTRSAHH